MTAEANKAIAAEGVRRAYGDLVALSGVSLSVSGSEVFALVGPNGAGKTTLVRALTGTTQAEGHVEVLGEDPRDVDPGLIGLLPQAFDPPDRLTAHELLRYYGGLYEGARSPEAVLADVGLTDVAGTRYENLSGGQRRRACVGTALVNDPEVLFLDEPTTGIDPRGRRAIWGLIEDLADSGAAVLFTTHDMAEAERLADRVGLLADGALVAVDTPGTLIDEHGGASRLEVRTDHREAVSRVLRNGGYQPILEAGTVILPGVGPGEVGDVVVVLNDGGVGYDAVAWQQPTLEEAYLRLTGTAVAEQGNPVESGEGTQQPSPAESADGEWS